MPKWVIYTKSYCGYCHQAKRLLQGRNIPFEEVDLLEHPQEAEGVWQRSGRRTVPQIFADGRPLGGFDDLSALDRSGELDRILKQP